MFLVLLVVSRFPDPRCVQFITHLLLRLGYSGLALLHLVLNLCEREHLLFQGHGLGYQAPAIPMVGEKALVRPLLEVVVLLASCERFQVLYRQRQSVVAWFRRGLLP